MSKPFTGKLAEHFQSFLDEKHAIGLEYREGERILHLLDEASKNYNCNNCLPKELVQDFVNKKPHWRKLTQDSRISIVRQFAVYLSNRGVTAYIPHRITLSNESFAPYIFSKNEMGKIFNRIDNLNHKSNEKIHIVFPVLYRMLYGCGLRVSEALALRICDVNLKDSTLNILDSKNHKDRIVPMSESLNHRCSEYIDTLHHSSKDKDFFFIHHNYKNYTSPSVIYHYFRQVIWDCGISHGGRSVGPRLHDLRHTFAVHSLKQFDENGVDLMTALPLLSAYLGHSNWSTTGLYLRLTADCFPSIAEKLETAYSHLIPNGGEIDETY